MASPEHGRKTKGELALSEGNHTHKAAWLCGNLFPAHSLLKPSINPFQGHCPEGPDALRSQTNEALAGRRTLRVNHIQSPAGPAIPIACGSHSPGSLLGSVGFCAGTAIICAHLFPALLLQIWSLEARKSSAPTTKSLGYEFRHRKSMPGSAFLSPPPPRIAASAWKQDLAHHFKGGIPVQIICSSTRTFPLRRWSKAIFLSQPWLSYFSLS